MPLPNLAHLLSVLIIVSPPLNPRSMPASLGVPGKWGVPIWICAPIDASFEHRAKSLLQLSEAQSALFHELLATTAAQDAEFRTPRLKALREQSLALGEQRGAVLSDPEIARQNSGFLENCREFISALAVIEERAFSQIEPALSEQQRLTLPQLKAFRQRQRWMVVPIRLFAAEVDLADLLNDLDSREVLERADADAFDQLLANYEFAMTGLARKRFEGKLESMRETAILVAENANDDDPTSQRQRSDRIKRLHRLVMTVETRMRDLNNSYVELLTDQLSDAAGERLLHEYRIRTYPEVWPNPFEATEFIEIVSNYVPQGKRVEFDQVTSAYWQRTEAFTLAMKHRVDRWLDQLSPTGDYDGLEFEKYQRDLDTLQRQRREEAANLIVAVRNFFGDQPPKVLEQAAWEFNELRKNHHGQRLRYSYLP